MLNIKRFLRFHIILILILIFAAFLRITAIDKYPVGLNADETNQGYTAYSILKTGRDEWGAFLPLSPRSFGDYRAPLYTYLIIPSVALLGLTPLAVRLPNALLGTAAVLFAYLSAYELLGTLQFGENIVKNRRTIALTSAFLLAISPWHIQLSRGAFESVLPVMLVPLALWAYLKGLGNPKWLYPAAFTFGVSLFSSYSARAFIPLFILLTVIFTYGKITGTTVFHKLINYIIPISIFGIFVALAGYSLLTGGATRGSDVSIFNPTDKWQSVAQRRYEAVLMGVPDRVAQLFSNKPLSVARQFTVNYLTYISPQFLFTQGAAETTYGMISGRGVLFYFEIVFILAFFCYLCINLTKYRSGYLYLILWLLLAIIPAALSKGGGSAANRAATMMPVIQFISALGAFITYGYLVPRFSKRKLIAVFMGLCCVSTIYFLEDYIYHSRNSSEPNMAYGWDQTGQYLKSVESKYQTIIVSRTFTEPQIFLAFFTHMDPYLVQSESQDWLRYQKQGLLFVDQLGDYALGKYTIRSINYPSDSQIPGALIIGKGREIPDSAKLLFEIPYSNGEPNIRVVEGKPRN